MDEHPDFTRIAPVPFSVVCFRWQPSGARLDAETQDAVNAELLEAVNRTGEIFISHSRIDGRYILRVAIGHERTTIDHVARAWALLTEHAGRIGEARGLR